MAYTSKSYGVDFAFNPQPIDGLDATTFTATPRYASVSVALLCDDEWCGSCGHPRQTPRLTCESCGHID
jgi:hypothetical protein